MHKIHSNQARIRALVAGGLAVLHIAAHAAVDSATNSIDADGWQVLASAPKAQPATAESPQPNQALPPPAPMSATAAPSADVPAVVLPGAGAAAASGTLTFSVTPADVNLRDALDRWLQQQGWQLAWKIDDDLPLEFNASFTGDFTSVLQQVMKATNHMRTPTRACRHTNNVIRVIARAGNCQD
ncbi:pilus assembly protein [Burkholderia multivorans]|uniref:toxin co-regulated pilus biosynthesis Q family protein n=1 Tax=Burkholderia TaxID=32008 RepID=UPI000277E293|nr:toxin co-regulated pilus biosynthesis Q family protein [Burkholderia multivorans]EJO51333.1 toxin co-regulated pilus biosynthesis protein Q [Burkholderia multivorans CF2]MBJ9654360.1 TcpQ domain-containing protein [Burkholderia multivorans]MBR8122514.1 TcpQ domain-containing protein [Burkholderia multivorans]MBU9165089.1 TcpQ domain-containing protein [Burkholderia multivorans]MBU9444124.1 TcpQ domain-containing protein [Burkholderia multivorans]